MSIYDRPINYDKDVIMGYDRTLVDNEDYINEKEEILKNRGTTNYKIQKTTNEINPLFTPATKILNQNNTNNIIKIDEVDYDPYLDFLRKKGLDNNNVDVRYNIEYINIDSYNRNKVPKNIPSVTYELSTDPLSISNNTLQISLTSDQIKNINIGDKFSLTGVQSLEQVYSAYKGGNTVLTFIKNKSYIQVNINPNIYSTKNLNLYQKYFDTSKVFVRISGVQGVKQNNYYKIQNNNPYNTTSNNIYTKTIQYSNDPTSPYIGNVPVSFINNQHQIYLLPPNDTSVIFDPNKFYILLPFASDGTNIISTDDNINNNYNITFDFDHYNFIPINEINADYPINSEHINGFQIVETINYTNNYITTKVYPPIDSNLINSSIFYYNNFGGDSIYLSIISQTVYGYPDQNNYTINLNKVYNNVVEIKLIDSTFINPAKTFYNTGSSKNNRIYFQNMENIENIQFIELTEGLYTYDTLKTEIETQFSKLTRSVDPINFVYDLNYNIKVSINTNTNVITFNSYKSKTLKTPINNVDPVINLNDTGIGVGTYTIVIDHPNHGITTQTSTVLFSGFIDHLGIPAQFLNTEHTITIIDNNRYSFILKNINLNQQKYSTNGGQNVIVLIPSPMKMYFNYSDTAGTVLGFRNVGYVTSITDYNYIINNSDPYLNEVNSDANGNIIILKNKAIQLYKFTYFLMYCDLSNQLTNANTKNNLFSKYRITQDNILNNEKTDIGMYFYDPIFLVDKLSFKFYNPDNTLVDFNGNDHSFIIQITTLDNMPLLTNINSTRTLIK